jgi:Ca2+-binding EF-hand superfamily protein
LAVNGDEEDGVLGSVVQRKTTALFRIFDSDSDGYWERNDFQRFVDRIASDQGSATGSPEAQALSAVYMQLWEAMRPADIDGDERVSLEEALAFQERNFTPEGVVAFARAIFPVLDSDHDGAIGLDEYRSLLKTSSIDPAVADEVFPRLDSDGDGRITSSQFEQLYLEYFLSDDADAPGSSLWGPF